MHASLVVPTSHSSSRLVHAPLFHGLQLMRELGKLEGLRWIRILYAYPSYFTEELVDEIASNPKAGPKAKAKRGWMGDN